MKIALCAFLAAATALPSLGSKADSVSDKDRLTRTIAQEQALVFDPFDNETALRLGMAMVKYAQDTKAPQTVFDIRRNGQILFRVSLSGSSDDNEHRVDEKIATMERFHVSTERKKLEFRAKWAPIG